MKKVSIGSAVLGDGTFKIIAGPCSIEGRDHFLETGIQLKELGVLILRGGIYKLRTNPQSFQGLGDEVFNWLLEAKNKLGLPLVSEVTDPRQIEKLSECIDCFQVGTRNMYNYELLKELGKQKKPVILKRAFSALVKEWIYASEYITREGNDNLIFCERGIRTFETITRNTLDLGAVAYLKAHTPYPVIVDPSHASGERSLVLPLTKAAKAVGADGALIEMHLNPLKALSDSDQSLDLMGIRNLIHELKNVADSKPATLS